MAGAADAAAAGLPTRRLLPAVTMLNEFGAEKVVSTTLRPASLPHIELHDLEGIAQARCGAGGGCTQLLWEEDRTESGSLAGTRGVYHRL